MIIFWSCYVNRLSLSEIVPDYNRPINNRAKLDTGTFCNYDCQFCYYKDRLDQRDELQIIFDRVDYIHAYGITEIDLSGGESSIEPNWFNILDYCNDKFDYISCLSHGGKFANYDYLKKSKEHGLKEVLFSLHGWDDESHDEITQRKGSFSKIIHAINNCHELGILVRINCTVYKPLPIAYAQMMQLLVPSQVNFLTLNYWSDNYSFEKIDYKELTDSIKKNIDVLEDIVGIEINVRYTPLCYMKDYEHYVIGQFQHIYDLGDWNKAIYDGKLDTSIQYTKEEKLKQAFAAAGKDRVESYFKSADCAKCKYFYICDGVENELKGIPVYPLPGDKIKCV